MNLQLPVIRGVIDRRILVNFRVDPGVAANLLPAPFRPRPIKGFALVGICLIRLHQVRARGLPALVGISSENAAHRIAVQWEADGGLCEGVFIFRRDTDSSINAWAGGRLFPGVHHHSHFESFERNGWVQVRMENRRDGTRVWVNGHAAPAMPATSVFSTLEEASQFFERGSVGYSPTRNPGEFDGLELRSFAWKIEPLTVDAVESSFFPSLFPRGALEFDSALLMRNVEHEWRAKGVIRSDCDLHSGGGHYG